ncbi:assimilatory nitrate reductase large subunit [Methyloceanibacter caenitepidi]|uniref:Assimilatory nitrate reductase large subunit n=1 Tax=Methyloceanibacter caenitepidi TaxID=1384459 RepID=A0A0A8K5P4_9HYPH|nr:assimilatory nitrate reductase large subunit [Methyloceanibacter caenitepidi]
MELALTVPPVRTTCPYCGVGCGVLAAPDGKGGTRISGDPDHPANFGRLCSKGSALGETLSFDGRLHHPMIRGADGRMAQASWSAALDRVADGFRETLERHGPDSVAFYVSGQLLTEDYYVANKLMKGFLGSANIDTNSRLCMASSVAGHKRAFGADVVPGCYEDLDSADLLVLTGSNAAWCHPILHQRMVKNRNERGARIVVIDPRRTTTAEDADLVLQIAPGTDSVLFSGLLVYLADNGVVDTAYIENRTDGYAEALARARAIAPTVPAVARACDLDVQDVAAFFDLFRVTEKAVTLYSQGVNQAAQGTDKVNAIINCHLATGRIGKEGMGPFSLTGQPNAMGGREVGGLANQLAAHMDFAPAEIDRVRRFWKAPSMATRPGLKAVDLFDAVQDGRIKALWVMATNPVVSLPRADRIKAALKELDVFVLSEAVASNDTLDARPDVLLPAATWGEKDGTVTNSERRISRQRAFLVPPAEAKPDWWIICEVAKRLGYKDAFGFRSPCEIFREHAALSTFENDGGRDFDIGGLSTLSPFDYEELAPVQWPVRAESAKGQSRVFADGRFDTPDGRGRFVAVEQPRPAARSMGAFPYRLNTGRVRDHWHTMTRTGKSPRLSSHIDEPFVEVSRGDAVAADLSEGGLARVTSKHGSAVMRVRVSEGQRRSELFAPIHWNAQTASSARVGAVSHAYCDPYSGQPDMKATPVRLEPVRFAAHGFVLSRDPVSLPADYWWARATVPAGTLTRFASNADPGTWKSVAQAMLGTDGGFIELRDEEQGHYRAAVVREQQLQACIYISSSASALPGVDWLKAQLGADAVDASQRKALLAGHAADGAADTGPIVCACFGVGLTAIETLIASGAATSVEEVGACLKAGTNCGSCQPEIKKLIKSNQGERALAGAQA